MGSLILPTRPEHLGHQGGVLRRDLLVGEVTHLCEAHDPLVERHPLVHAAQFDVGDDVVDRPDPQLHAGAGNVSDQWGEPGRKVPE